MRNNFLLFLILSQVVILGCSILDSEQVENQEGKCYPIFEVIEDTPELSAEQLYSTKCTYVTNKEECEKVDIYDKYVEAFGNADGIPDCYWKIISP